VGAIGGRRAIPQSSVSRVNRAGFALCSLDDRYLGDTLSGTSTKATFSGSAGRLKEDCDVEVGVRLTDLCSVVEDPWSMFDQALCKIVRISAGLVIRVQAAYLQYEQASRAVVTCTSHATMYIAWRRLR